jgi:Fur family transcriptional regulator, iron response regulator
MTQKVVELLARHGIQPSAHRVAVAQYVLTTDEHPSADRVWSRVRRRFPMISRATVYNVLNLFVEKNLLRELHLAPDSVVFDPNMNRHHHVIDDESGRIYDLPWDQVEVRNVARISGFEIRDYQVVMQGRRKPQKKRS